MKTEFKVLIGVMMTLLVAIPLMSYVSAIPAYNLGSNEEPNLACSEQWEAVIRERLQHRKEVAGRWFLKEAEDVAVEGTVVTHFRHILVIDSEGKRLNILLPRVWSINFEDKAINVSEIFEGNYVAAGDAVTIKALQREATNEKGVTVTIIVAYEITNGDNNLHAILPFNINP